jgi:hypothetical protein
VFEQLTTRLATPPGFPSSLAVQQGLREAYGREGPYKTLHGMVPYQLKAKRKRPRPGPAKKPRQKRRTLSSSARAASGPWRP